MGWGVCSLPPWSERGTKRLLRGAKGAQSHPTRSNNPTVMDSPDALPVVPDGPQAATPGWVQPLMHAQLHASPDLFVYGAAGQQGAPDTPGDNVRRVSLGTAALTPPRLSASPPPGAGDVPCARLIELSRAAE